MAFSKSILKKITTSDVKKPDSPQITIGNLLDDDTTVNGIELILSAEFSKKGKLLILVNDVAVFNEGDSEQFEGYAKYPIPLGKTLRRSEDVKIFAWNGTDTNSIKISVNLSISLKPEPFSSQAVPLGKDVFNSVVSTPETILAQDTYTPQTITHLLDLEGYRRFWALISAQNYDAPSTLAETGWTDPENAIDGDDATKATVSIGAAIITETYDVDFGEIIDSFHVHMDVQLQTSSGNTPNTMRTKVQYKEDILDSWSDASSRTDTKNYASPPGTLDFTIDTDYVHDARYVRVSLEKLTTTGSTEVSLWEVYDPDKFGGTLALSFEIRNPNDEWFEIIPSSEFGTISQGQSVAVQIGDTLTKKYAIPQTQTDFRAKMIIAGGGLNTGVSIMKVA